MSMIHIMANNKSRLHSVRTEDVQPNAVDLRVDKILKIVDNSVFSISEQSKQHRQTIVVELNESDQSWYLVPGTYEIVMENEIEVGEGEAGWVITRSTLNRNGVFITSGLYDSGYKGKMAGALHVTTGPMIIKRGTRVGQFLLFKSQSLGKYEGSYGSHSEHDKKYL